MPNPPSRLPCLLLLVGLTAATACSRGSHPPQAAAPAAATCERGRVVSVVNGAGRDVDVYSSAPPALRTRLFVGTVPARTTATLPLSPQAGTRILVVWSGANLPDDPTEYGLVEPNLIIVRIDCR